MEIEKVLIVEDEENERNGLAELISAWGFRTETARDGVEGLEKLLSWSPGIVVSDLKMPRMDGLGLLERVAQTPREVSFILLTAQGSVDAAVSAMKLGAYDFIEKPVNPARLRNILQNASRQRGTDRELEATRRQLRDSGKLGCLVGASRKMQEIFRLIELVAPSTASVLITGESGTGKELVARTIHDLSPAQGQALRRHQLRRHPRNPDRKRDLRPRKGRLHRCPRAPHRLLRAGRRRHPPAR